MTAGRRPGDVDGGAFGPAATAANGASEPVTYELASWGVRAAAFLLDMLVIAAVGVVLGIAVIVFEGDATEARRVAERLSFVVGVPLGLLYGPLLMVRRGRNGQTLGKQWMRIRVVRENGQPVTITTGLLREVIGRQLLVAFTYGVYALADYLWPLWDKQRQCLHDKVAQTRVVRGVPPTRSGADATPHAVGVAAEDGVEAGQRSSAPPLPPHRAEDDRPVRDGWLPPAPGR